MLVFHACNGNKKCNLSNGDQDTAVTLISWAQGSEYGSFISRMYATASFVFFQRSFFFTMTSINLGHKLFMKTKAKALFIIYFKMYCVYMGDRLFKINS